MIEIRNGESTGLLSHHQGLWHNYFPVHVCTFFNYMFIPELDVAAAGIANVITCNFFHWGLTFHTF